MSDPIEPPEPPEKPLRFTDMCGEGDCSHAPSQKDANKPGKGKGMFSRLMPEEPAADAAPESPPTPPPDAPAPPAEHIHGSSCNHASSTPSEWHVHGPSCGHGHPSRTPLPKEKSVTALWVAGIAAVVGIGAYLINAYGKKPDKPSAAGGWQQRISAEKAAKVRS